MNAKRNVNKLNTNGEIVVDIKAQKNTDMTELPIWTQVLRKGK